MRAGTSRCAGPLPRRVNPPGATTRRDFVEHLASAPNSQQRPAGAGLDLPLQPVHTEPSWTQCASSARARHGIAFHDWARATASQPVPFRTLDNSRACSQRCLCASGTCTCPLSARWLLQQAARANDHRSGRSQSGLDHHTRRSERGSAERRRIDVATCRHSLALGASSSPDHFFLTRSIPHFGHRPGLSATTSVCIGQT